MPLSPVTIREGLAKRILAIGLSEAKGPLGAEMEPATVIDRSFDVQFGDDADTGERVKSGAHVRLVQSFAVRLVHRIKLGKGGDARDVAIADKAGVMRAMLNRASPADTISECEATITYLGGTMEDRGGGAYVYTLMRWSVTYHLDLTAGA